MNFTDKELYDNIKDVLLKKAKGYFYDEEIYEYQNIEESDKEEENSKRQTKSVSHQLDFFSSDLQLSKPAKSKKKTNLQLTKKKVTSHHVPPDLAAVKMLIELFGNIDNNSNDLSKLSEEELSSLKEELIKKLSE